MTPRELLERANRAIGSAELLLSSGDLNGACNRAYYAMFDAARAALTTAHPPPASEAIKTHSGLISAFGLRLVKTGAVPIELGKAFTKVAEIRLIADYSDEEVSADRAAWAIERAKEFVKAMQAHCARSPGGEE